MKEYKEIEVGDSLTLQALIDSYKDHIETLKKRISELEGVRLVGPPLRNSSTFTGKPVLRTTSQMIAELEKRSQLKFDREVKDEDVK
jgi:hypothetical protein